MNYSIKTPLTMETVKKLKAGDIVKISGVVYTARDAAHKKMITLLNEGKSLPFDVENQVIYYVGPCPGKTWRSYRFSWSHNQRQDGAYAPN